MLLPYNATARCPTTQPSPSRHRSLGFVTLSLESLGADCVACDKARPEGGTCQHYRWKQIVSTNAAHQLWLHPLACGALDQGVRIDDYTVDGVVGTELVARCHQSTVTERVFDKLAGWCLYWRPDRDGLGFRWWRGPDTLVAMTDRSTLTRQMVAESLARMQLVDPAVDLAAAQEAEALGLATEADARRRSRDSAA